MELQNKIFLGAAMPDVDDGALVILQNKRILFLTMLAAYVDMIVKGVSPLSLPGAIADSLEYLKAFGGTEHVPQTYIDSVTAEGKCEQASTPTPSSPVDIVCNNGVLKLSPNLFNKNTPDVLLEGFPNAAGAWTVSNNFRSIIYQLTEGQTYTITRATSTPTSAAMRVMAYSTNNLATANVQVLYVGDNSDKVATITVPSGYPYVLTYVKHSSDVITNQELLDGFQIEKGSMATPYHAYGSVYADGTQETVTDANGNVANCEMLLGVSTYKDTQEIISGAITRNIGIKVFDGSESWIVTGTGTTNIQFRLNNVLNDGAGENLGLITHFVTVGYASNPDTMQVGMYLQASYNRLYANVPLSFAADLTAWQQWLADQYNAGTPVILVYPLATATTESVTGQFLSKSPVTYAGSLTGLTGTVTETSHITPTPAQPLDIRCNNGVLKYGAFYQQMNAADYSDWTNTTTDGTAQVVDGSMVYTVTQEPTGNYTLRGSPAFPLTADNKLYVTFDIYLSRSATRGQVSDNNGRITDLNTFQGVTWDNANVWQTVKLSASANAYGLDFQSQCYPLIQISGWTIGDYWKIRNYRVYDLTAIFGAGNEPTTLADIEAALFGVYPVGTVETIQVTGKNLFDVSDYNEESDWELSSYRYVEIPLPNGTYTVSWDKTKGAPSIYWLIQVTESVAGTSDAGSGGSWLWHATVSSLQKEKFTFTVTEGKAWFSCNFGSDFNNFLAMLETVQIELGPTATDYAPYYNGGSLECPMLLSVGG